MGITIGSDSPVIISASGGGAVARTLSSLQDFSAAGLTEGDYGIHTPSGGAPILVRYKAAVTIASGAGGGSTPMWLPPAVYAGTPEIKSYLVGTEANDTAINNRGWTVSRLNDGTVGTAGGYIRLFGPINASGSQGAITAPAITGANKFYLVGDFRGSASGSDPYVGIFGNANNSNPAQYVLGRGASSGYIRQLTWITAWTFADTPAQIQFASPGASIGLNWPASTPYLVQAFSGSTISDLIESRFDGKLYSSFRRNFDGATDVSSYAIQLLANGGGGSTTSQLEVKNVYFLTY